MHYYRKDAYTLTLFSFHYVSIYLLPHGNPYM